MAMLPANDEMTGAGVTQGQFKARLNDVLTFCRDVFGSSGSVGAVRTALGLGALATRNEVTPDDIPTGAVTAAKIADGAVGAAKLADGAVTGARIASLAVGTGAIAAGAVTSAKIAGGVVGTAQLADGAATAVKIADGSIGAVKIGDGQVVAAKLADAAVGTSKIADGAVTAAKLAAGAIAGANAGGGAQVFRSASGSTLSFRSISVVNTTSGSGSEVAGVGLAVSQTADTLVLTLTVALYSPGTGGGGGTCFIAGTLVTLASGRMIPIEDVRIGDAVLGAKGERNRVMALDRPLLGQRSLWDVDGLITTSEHRFWTDEGWRCIDLEAQRAEWNVAHRLIFPEGEQMVVKPAMTRTPLGRLEAGATLLRHGQPWSIARLRCIGPSDPQTQLYNLVVDGSHIFQADGFPVSGFARDDDFDYARWARLVPEPVQ